MAAKYSLRDLDIHSDDDGFLGTDRFNDPPGYDMADRAMSGGRKV